MRLHIHSLVAGLALLVSAQALAQAQSQVLDQPEVKIQGLVLPEISANADKALPVDVTEQNIPCGEIVARLENYNKMARQHDGSVSTFLGEVTGKMLNWYDLLFPLEGATDAIPAGVFAPLQDGANKISAVTDLAYENSSLLANEMDRLITSLKDCSLTAPVGKP